jgi:anti-sigma factor RsiW
MPHIPDNAHDTHDLELVAAYAAGDAGTGALERATALVATCSECAALHHDLRAIAAALPELPAPVRPRDFRLTPEQAASLRPGGIRGLLAAFSGPRFAFATPLGTGLAALGIVGVLVASGGFPTGGATGGAAVTAPEVAPAASDAMYGAAEAPSAAPEMLAAPSEDANTGLAQKSSPTEPAASAAPADGTTIAAAAPETGPSPLGALSLVVVLLGGALLGARFVARRLASGP